MAFSLIQGNRTDRRNDCKKKAKELKNLLVFDTIVRLGRRSIGDENGREDEYL